MKCPNCDGRGSLISYDGTNPHAYLISITKCETCGGTGEVKADVIKKNQERAAR